MVKQIYFFKPVVMTVTFAVLLAHLEPLSTTFCDETTNIQTLIASVVLHLSLACKQIQLIPQQVGWLPLTNRR